MDIYDQWKGGIGASSGNFTFSPEIPSDFLQEFTNVCRVRTEVQHGRDKGFSSQLGDKAEKIIKNKFCKSSRESGPKVVFSKRYIYT